MAESYYKKFDVPVNMSDENFQKIIQFFLFECPVPGARARGKNFEDYGINGKANDFAKLKKAMLAAASQSLRDNDNENYVDCDNDEKVKTIDKKDKLELELKRVETISPPKEYCVFLVENGVEMPSLYKRIRNAFAHGRFNMINYLGVKIYFLQDFQPTKSGGFVSGEMALHESTLLNWIDCVQNFASYKSTSSKETTPDSEAT